MAKSTIVEPRSLFLLSDISPLKDLMVINLISVISPSRIRQIAPYKAIIYVELEIAGPIAKI
jgi:hypothetical protein